MPAVAERTQPATAIATGQAAVFTAPRRIAFTAQPRPEPGPRSAVVRNRLTLISPGTELAIFTGTHNGIADPTNSWTKYPFRPGYAAVGEVLSAGPDSPLTPGARVLYPGQHATWGVADPGRDFCVQLPAHMSDGHALMARLAQIAATAAWLARGRPQRVVVQGVGPIGNFAAQWYRLRHGSRVVAIDPCRERRAAAIACGIDVALTPEEATADALVAACGGEADVVVDATGRAALLDAALERVRRGGEVQLLGAGHSTMTLDPYRRLFSRFVALNGIHECMLPNLPTPGIPGSRQELIETAVAAVAAGRLRVGPLLTTQVPSDHLGEAYEALLADPGRHLGVTVAWAAP